MDFELSEEPRAFQELARDFAANEMAPQAARWDEEEIFPVAALRKAAALGFAGIYVRDDVGGASDLYLVICRTAGEGTGATARHLSVGQSHLYCR